MRNSERDSGFICTAISVRRDYRLRFEATDVGKIEFNFSINASLRTRFMGKQERFEHCRKCREFEPFCEKILIIFFVWDTNMAAMSIVFCVSWDCVKTENCLRREGF